MAQRRALVEAGEAFNHPADTIPDICGEELDERGLEPYEVPHLCTKDRGHDGPHHDPQTGLLWERLKPGNNGRED